METGHYRPRSSSCLPPTIGRTKPVIVRIKKAIHAEQKLPLQVAKLFSVFATLANPRHSTPLDWQRFYEFVRYAARKSLRKRGRPYSKSGFNAPYTEHTYGIYRHLWSLKRTR